MLAQFTRLTLLAALVLSLSPACGDNGDDGGVDHDSFATYQACWDEHHTTEMFTAPKAVTICCLSHPIGDQAMNVVCGDTATSCEAYVGTSLGSAAAATDITTGCTDYITQRGM